MHNKYYHQPLEGVVLCSLCGKVVFTNIEFTSQNYANSIGKGAVVICPSCIKIAPVKPIGVIPVLVAAINGFLRAPSIGSDGPGSSTVVIQRHVYTAAKAAITMAQNMIEGRG